MSLHLQGYGAQAWQERVALRIGVDVGGTNTDVAVMQGSCVLSWHKARTSSNITQGVAAGIRAALSTLQQELSSRAGTRAGGAVTYAQLAAQVQRVCIGTTHFVNAVVERRRRDLSPVVVVRLCSDASQGVPPFIEFPRALADCMAAKPRSHYFARGGFDFNQVPMDNVNPAELRKIAAELRQHGNNHVVISCVFATLQGCQVHEIEAERIIREEFPDVSITMSHKVGRMGLLERENSAILNESLKSLCHHTILAFDRALQSLNLHCPFYLTKNDGTLISASKARSLPVATFSCGPTNSARGANFLSGIAHAVVLDIGGTTIDSCYIRNGYPRQASSEVKIAGVSVGYRMADTISIGYGGGSIVRQDASGKVTVGPQSVGFRLSMPETGQAGIVFGGSTLTASDVAIAAGMANDMKASIDADGAVCDDRLAAANIDPRVVEAAYACIQDAIVDITDVVKGSAGEVDVILVGGGSELVDTRESRRPPGVSRFVKPQLCQVANAIGAALGQISASVEGIYTSSNDPEQRAQQHAAFREQARELCVAHGALRESVVVQEPTETAMSYLPGREVQIHVLAVGDIDESREVSLEEEIEQPLPAAPVIEPAADGDDNPATAAAEEFSPPVKHDKILGSLPDYVERQINPETGEWTLNVYDVWCLTIGAGLLGCGGGGSPSLAKLRCLRALDQGACIRVIPLDRIGSCPELTGVVASVAFMGAPTVVKEKLVAGNELRSSICAVQKLYNKEHHADILVEERDKGLTVVVSGLDDVCLPQHAERTRAALSQRTDMPGVSSTVALMPLEVGGLNGIGPLVIAAEMGVPVVDCDGMGRAFPELQMFIPFIYGVQPCPCALVSADGRWRACTAVRDHNQLETFMREAVGTFGCIAALSVAPLEKSTMEKYCVAGSLTTSYKIGHAALSALREHLDPVTAIERAAKAVLITRGKIIDSRLEVKDAFARGNVTIASFLSWDSAGTQYRIDIQNEYICCLQLNRTTTGTSDHCAANQREPSQAMTVVATAPHLITLVDDDTGFPITTEELRTGQRVAVLAAPADPLLLRPEALRVVGPQHFMSDAEQYGGIAHTEPIFPERRRPHCAE
eukprot:scpid21990/ scgid4210/ Uncharacterized protein MJ0964